MSTYCPKGCERLQSAQILNQFELICSATNFHKTSRNTCILYCYTAFKSEFSQQVSKDMEMWGGSITKKQKPNYSFLRDSDQDIWNQLLTLFFIMWRLFIWIYKLWRDPEKEDAVKVISMFISLFLFKQGWQWRHPLWAWSWDFQPLCPAVTSRWGDLDNDFSHQGTGAIQAWHQAGGWAQAGYSGSVLHISYCFKRSRSASKKTTCSPKK